MSNKTNKIIIAIMFSACIFTIAYLLFFRVEKVNIPVESIPVYKNERLCEIIDSNKQVIKYFTGDIDYIEKETYIQIIKKNGDCNDSIFILPNGIIRFFNIEENNDEKNTRPEK
jgi:hypothetical protein